MRKILKSFASVIFVPLTRWYLRKERLFTYRGTTISVWPGVFHPGLFTSTKFVLQYLETQKLAGQKLLEIGCGSGLIAIIAAKAHAKVTALDISQTAVQNTRLNAQSNNVVLRVLHSDLFDGVNQETYDWIIINPPYYARNPENENDLAWYCGKNFEYFKRLFEGLPLFLHSQSNVIMVFTKTSELETVISLGNESGFEFALVQEKRGWFDEKDFLYSLRFKASGKERS